MTLIGRDPSLTHRASATDSCRRHREIIHGRGMPRGDLEQRDRCKLDLPVPRIRMHIAWLFWEELFSFALIIKKREIFSLRWEHSGEIQKCPAKRGSTCSMSAPRDWTTPDIGDPHSPSSTWTCEGQLAALPF